MVGPTHPVSERARTERVQDMTDKITAEDREFVLGILKVASNFLSREAPTRDERELMNRLLDDASKRLANAFELETPRAKSTVTVGQGWWSLVFDMKCPHCGTENVNCHVSDSDGYEDTHYWCAFCNKDWWVDGPDS